MFQSLLLFLTVALQSLTTDQNVQGWTAMELEAANTGRNAVYLNDVEKETLLYLNLARLYPKRYASKEVPKDMLYTRNEKAKWQAYRRSLLKDLNSMQPVAALSPDSAMAVNAQCFAKESSDLGKVGHQRERCPKENYSESNAYGIENGKAIVMHLLIDYNIPNVAHRSSLLSSVFSTVGIGFNSNHAILRHCCIIVLQ